MCVCAHGCVFVANCMCMYMCDSVCVCACGRAVEERREISRLQVWKDGLSLWFPSCKEWRVWKWLRVAGVPHSWSLLAWILRRETEPPVENYPEMQTRQIHPRERCALGMSTVDSWVKFNATDVPSFCLFILFMEFRMASQTRRTWVWASSRSWWWTGKPG